MSASEAGMGRRLRRLADPLGELTPPWHRRRHYAALASYVVVMAVLFTQVVHSDLVRNEMNQWVLYSLVGLGFYFVFGLAGQFAFSQSFMMALGAYTSAYASRDHSAWLGLVAAVAVAGLLALAVGWLLRRAQAFYFAMGTLALAEIGSTVFRRAESFTGPNGSVVAVKPLSILGEEVYAQDEIFWVLLGVFSVAMVLAVWLERSPLRRRAIAGRDGELVASACGVPVVALRIQLFVVASCAAGLAGALFAHWKGTINTESFGLELGLGIFLMLLIGGKSSIWGPVLGAAVYVFLPEVLTNFDRYRSILYGVILVVAIIAFPEGIAGAVNRVRRRLIQDPSPTAPAKAESTSSEGLSTRPAAEEVLGASDLRVSFGGVHAVGGVSITARAGQVIGVIGPNGSGKSTLLNALTGIVPATGRLVISGETAALGRPRRIRALGIARGFQNPQAFEDLTCIENVMLADADEGHLGVLSAWFRRPTMWARERSRSARAQRLLIEVGFEERIGAPVAELSYGQRRLLELARMLGAEPKILLLDEPTAGFNAEETAQFTRLLGRVTTRGQTVILVDHKLDFVNAICTWVEVMDQGRIVASGPPPEIWADDIVKSTYLGTFEDA